MIQAARHYKTRLAVIGSGLAGCAASIFARKRGIATAQVGKTGAIAYTSGYFDLLGGRAGRLLDDPWEGLDALREEQPGHPLARIGNEDIRVAFRQFTATVGEMGIGYTAPADRNLYALLPAGTTKPTLSVPLTMRAGVAARIANAKVLIADFVGLNGFSANEVVANLKVSWPRLTAARLAFPDMESGAEVYPEVMARTLELAVHRQRLAERIKAVAGDAEWVGLPAIMGIHAPDEVHAELQRLVGVPLFEIPTMPPAVPGIRLRELFEQALPASGVTLITQQKVTRLDLRDDGATLYLKDSYGDVVIETQATILATGRFLSGGLRADRGGVRETLLNIPVSQPRDRDEWYQRRYFDPRGHRINRCGVEVDAQFRPLDGAGRPVNQRLFAAGVLLAHQDWIRQRCGAGVAIASAYKAVQSASAILGPA